MIALGRTDQRIIFSLILVVAHMCLVAQRGDPRSSGRPTDFGAGQALDTLVVRPTLKHQFVLASDVNSTYNVSDTTLEEEIYILDPTQKGFTDYIHLGYFGSSAIRLNEEQNIPYGFNTGYGQYNLYRQPLDSLRFYTSNRTVADLAFFQRNGGQDNFMSSAEYGQRFSEGINFSINFKRYNFDHIYNEANNQSTSFGIGFLMKNDSSNWASFIAFQNNSHNESFNGGIIDGVDLQSEFSQFRSRVGINLDDTRNRHSEKEFRWHLERMFFNKKLKLFSDLGVEDNRYFYYDRGNLTASDSSIYSPLTTDIRGQRVEWGFNRYYAKVSFDFSYKKYLQINAALRYDLLQIRDRSNTSFRNDITILYNGLIKPTSNWDIDVSGHLGIGSNAGNFLLDLSTDIQLRNWLTSTLGWKNYLQEVGYVANNLSSHNIPIYLNDLPKIFGTSVYAQLSIPKAHLALDFSQSLINNYLIFDSTSMPKVLDDVLSVTRLRLKNKLKLWRFGFNNFATFQVYSASGLGLPNWYTKHDLYYESVLFRNNLRLRLGSYARLMPAHFGRAFQPLTGQGIIGNNEFPFYPEWTGYISGKISSFRFVVSYHNIWSQIVPEENFNIARYPMIDPVLRFGIRWLLLD